MVSSTLVGDKSGVTEAIRGMVSGVAYGVTYAFIGHPIDSIKTKMQT